MFWYYYCSLLFICIFDLPISFHLINGRLLPCVCVCMCVYCVFSTVTAAEWPNRVSIQWTNFCFSINSFDVSKSNGNVRRTHLICCTFGWATRKEFNNRYQLLNLQKKEEEEDWTIDSSSSYYYDSFLWKTYKSSQIKEHQVCSWLLEKNLFKWSLRSVIKIHTAGAEEAYAKENKEIEF